jgi:hypothetical protein
MPLILTLFAVGESLLSDCLQAAESSLGVRAVVVADNRLHRLELPELTVSLAALNLNGK